MNVARRSKIDRQRKVACGRRVRARLIVFARARPMVTVTVAAPVVSRAREGEREPILDSRVSSLIEDEVVVPAAKRDPEPPIRGKAN